jgi:hypothetical protein
MRLLAAIAVFSVLSPLSAFASGLDDKIPDQQAITALENRASQATPKEQCFLYAELVHQMTELAGRQLSAGDIQSASFTIHSVQAYASKIHMGLADDSKRLKNAEILMRHTAFRLKEILYGSPLDDRPSLEATLQQLDQVQSELMMKVFKH